MPAGPAMAAAPLGAAVSTALQTVDANIAAFGARYPDDTTVAGRYRLRPPQGDLPAGSNRGWTTSFWPGQLWLAGDLTRDDRYRVAAAEHVSGFARRIQDEVDVETHDLGFLYTLSCVVPAERLGDRNATAAALRAADHLWSRYLPLAGIIQAWGDPTDPRQQGRAIIDSLMNLPLLYWASRTTGDGRYATAARTHAGRLRDLIVRADGTTFHTYFVDVLTGEPLHGSTEQGYADDSCWARGQAWAIYGFALSYRHTEDVTFLRTALRCATYFLDHLPADRVPYWDLVFGDGSGQPRDASAAAIAACGLLELADQCPDASWSDQYRSTAEAIVGSLAAHYAAAPSTSNALLLHSVYDLPKQVGVDEGCLWGDYFYLEALTRLQVPDWNPYW